MVVARCVSVWPSSDIAVFYPWLYITEDVFTFADAYWQNGGTGGWVPWLGAVGVGAFVAPLWALGWAFLWYRGKEMRPVESSQHLGGMPPALLLRFKLFATAYECYIYCGFSYFPALPWKAMEVPPNVPHPQVVMLAGFFDFGGADMHFWTFVGSVAIVVLSFVLLGLAKTLKDVT